TRTPNGRNRQDACSTAPPFPVAVNPVITEGGRRSNGAVFTPAPANSLTSAIVNASPGGEVAPGGVMSVPAATPTAPVEGEECEPGGGAVLQLRADLSLNPFARFAQDYLAVTPPPGAAPPSGPLAPFSVDAAPIVSVQGNPSIGTVILNGIAPSGGAVVSL